MGDGVGDEDVENELVGDGGEGGFDGGDGLGVEVGQGLGGLGDGGGGDLIGGFELGVESGQGGVGGVERGDTGGDVV